MCSIKLPKPSSSGRLMLHMWQFLSKRIAAPLAHQRPSRHHRTSSFNGCNAHWIHWYMLSAKRRPLSKQGRALRRRPTRCSTAGSAPRYCNCRKVPLATAGHRRRVLGFIFEGLRIKTSSKEGQEDSSKNWSMRRKEDLKREVAPQKQLMEWSRESLESDTGNASSHVFPPQEKHTKLIYGLLRSVDGLLKTVSRIQRFSKLLHMIAVSSGKLRGPKDFVPLSKSKSLRDAPIQ